MMLGRILAATNQSLIANRFSGLEPMISTQSADAMLADLFRYGVIIAGILAAVFLTLAGFQYMTTDAVGKKGNAKKRITEIILGLLIALSSVLILRVINPATLTVAFGRFGAGTKLGGPRDASLGTQFIQTAEGKAQQDARPQQRNNEEDQQPQTRPNSDTFTESPLPTDPGVPPENPLLPPLADSPNNQPFQTSPEGDIVSGPLSDSNARLLLGDYGIRVNDTSRTSLEGLQSVTAYGLVGIKEEMKVDSLVITGGTESGHATGEFSHASGYKVDLGKNSNASNWGTIKGYFESKAGRPLSLGDTFTTSSDSYNMKVYYHTGSGEHFDVQFTPK